MPASQFELILLHNYAKANPAIDQSGFLMHGECIATGFAADGMAPGSGAFVFAHPNSAVKVPMAPQWKDLRGLIIEALVKLDGPIAARQNIVEGDSCFAFYVTPGGELCFDLVSLTGSQTKASWNGISSIAHATASPASLVPNKWVKVRAGFDGATTARLWIDDALVAERHDFHSGLGSPGPAGISIGNWTLHSQYALQGALDQLAIWKIDEQKPLHDFLQRPSTEGQQSWQSFLNCLSQGDGKKLLDAALSRIAPLLMEVMTRVANADPALKSAFYALLDRYSAFWKANNLADGAYQKVLAEIYEILVKIGGTPLANEFQSVATAFDKLLGSQTASCLKGSGLANTDADLLAALSSPAFAGAPNA